MGLRRAPWEYSYLKLSAGMSHHETGPRSALRWTNANMLVVLTSYSPTPLSYSHSGLPSFHACPAALLRDTSLHCPLPRKPKHTRTSSYT